MTKYVELMYCWNIVHVVKVPLDCYQDYSMEKIEEVETENAKDDMDLLLIQTKDTLVHSEELFVKAIRILEE